MHTSPVALVIFMKNVYKISRNIVDVSEDVSRMTVRSLLESISFTLKR